MQFYSSIQDTPPADTQASLPRVHLRSERHLSKRVLGLMIVTGGTLGLLQNLLQTPGVEAAINARVITLRAPINGEVQAGPKQLEFATSIELGDILFRIINPRADRSRIDELTRKIHQLKDERLGIEARLAGARLLLENLTEQTRLFVDSRILQLEARTDELRAELATVQAKNVEAKASHDRFKTLAGKGWLPKAQLDQAQRDRSIAEGLEAAAQKRLEAVSVELAAAKRGVFVGSSNNDRPHYMRHRDELEQQVNTLAETLAERDRHLGRISDELGNEEARYSVLATAEMVAPARGIVWEILTAPKEQVHVGQDLLRVLDCGGGVVTAIIRGDLHKRLQIGSFARFQPPEGREDFPGIVIRLSDASSSPVNLAVPPSRPTRGSYHVTVTVPKLAEAHRCMVGHTGHLFFNDRPTAQ